jgi:hypothetical protein
VTVHRGDGLGGSRAGQQSDSHCRQQDYARIVHVVILSVVETGQKSKLTRFSTSLLQQHNG